MTLGITPLHPHIGARAEGVDLRQPVSAELARQIEAAMDRHAVLVFPGQDIDDDQQMDFASNFGPIETTRATVDVAKQRLAHPLMNDISNLDEKGAILAADDRRRMFNLGNRLWHSDSSFKATPAKYSMLHAKSIPPEGGETEFADMRAAWDALPAKTQDLSGISSATIRSSTAGRCWGSANSTRRSAASSRPCRSASCAAMRVPAA